MNNKDRTYSFCLLTYNQAETVEDAVKSALAQDCPPMQIVISDDCSADSTFTIIEKTVASYAGHHKIVLNRNERNLGLAGHIDVIHDLSIADVIIAAAGDDVSLPNRTQRVMAAFESENPLLVCSHAIVIDPQGQELSGNFHRASFYRDWNLSKVAGSNSLYIGATGAWARELYTKFGRFDPQAYEDLVFGFRAALEDRVCVIEEKLVKYRLGNGITSSAEYLGDRVAFNAHRAQSFVVAAAILRQRTIDAETFGLAANSAVWPIIRTAQTYAKIGLSYYQGTSADLLWCSIRHPLLVISTVYAERRRLRKMLRQTRKLAQADR